MLLVGTGGQKISIISILDCTLWYFYLLCVRCSPQHCCPDPGGLSCTPKPSCAPIGPAPRLNRFIAPFNDLMFQAHSLHRRYFDPNAVQISKLSNIKSGGCPEDCGYCSQSARNGSALPASKLVEVKKVLAEARKAKAGGATRFCMGGRGVCPKTATWRN